MRIFGAVFWAIILIVIGVFVILKQVFNWDISIFPIIIGVILVYVGITIIAGPPKNQQNNIFAGGQVTSLKSGDNNYIFSSVILDMDDVQYENVEINSIFSSVKLLTNGKSVKIESTGVFSQTLFPDKSSLSFGDRVYERDGANTVNIETNCVFGSIIIE